MNSKYLIIGFVLLFVTFGCEKENENLNGNESFSINYLKGSSWVNYSFKASFDQNGSLLISENAMLSDTHRESEYQLSKVELISIREKLTDMVFIDINDSYGFGENKPTDLPVTFIQYNFGSRKDSTTIYFPEENEIPKELEALLNTVIQIISDKDTKQ